MNTNSNSDPAANAQTVVYNTVGWLFGLLVVAIGLLNTFWGNDPGFGIFLILLSLAYFPPANALLREKTRFSVPMAAKIALGAFILWAALGVGELFDKIELMRMDF